MNRFNYDDERSEMIWSLVTKSLVGLLAIMVIVHLIIHFYE
ncbi:hypothetical protein OX284_010090 [Flavobacterium sp. SUN046]|nr:hypothetical protein [Flavobacterium sp. SUN046]MEC4049777.1 hypothetical protein [Flavobacterium sp. SUN046]